MKNIPPFFLILPNYLGGFDFEKQMFVKKGSRSILRFGYEYDSFIILLCVSLRPDFFIVFTKKKDI